MASYFEEFRKTATPAEPEKQTDADVETLVNNQEIKDDVTEMGEVNPNEADVSEFDNKVDGIHELIELRDTIAANPVSTESHPLIDMQLKLIQSMYGLTVATESEEEGGEGRFGKIKDAIKTKLTAVAKTIREAYFDTRVRLQKESYAYPSFILKGDVQAMVKDFKSHNKNQIEQFNKYVLNTKSKYVNSQGKLPLPKEVVGDIRQYAAAVSTGLVKAINTFIAGAGSVKTEAEANALVGKALKAGKVDSLKLDINGYKVMFAIKVQEGKTTKLETNIDKVTFFNGEQYLCKYNHTDAVKWLDDAQAGWDDYRKLFKELDKTWEQIKDISNKLEEVLNKKVEEVQNGTDSNDTLYALETGAIALYGASSKAYKVIKQVMKYPSQYIKGGYNTILTPYTFISNQKKNKGYV